MLKKKKFKITEQILKSDTGVKVKKDCDISEVLETFGKYQVIQYLLICLSTLCISMISINYVFVAGDINYRCRVDECETVNSTAKFPNWWPDSHIDRCSKPVLKTGEEVCINSSFTRATVPCNNWIYESNDTVVAEFNLACKPWYSNLIGIIHGLGMLVSMIGFGWISDTFGRKPTVIVCIVVGCIGQIKTLITSYNTYLIIEFIEGAFTGGSYSATLVLLLEITSKKYRAWAGVLFSYAFHFGECLFAFISYLEPNWKTIIHIINAPSIFFIVYIFIINESPRWQIVKGEVKKAKKIFKKIIKINGLSINEDELENLDDAELKEKFNLESQAPKEGFASIFKSKEIMKRAIIMFICRFAVRLIYSGMMLNSVWLPGDKHLNFFLTVVVSFPGETIALYLTYKVGRRGPLIAGFSICGILCIVSAVTPRIYLWLKLTIFFISKLVLSLCFSGIVTYSMELFPTSVRGTLLGFGSFGSRSAIMIAAITPILNTIFEGLPLILFGSMGIISSFLLVCTPETKNSPLFDTIDQVETHLVNSKNKNISTIKGQMESSVNNS